MIDKKHISKQFHIILFIIITCSLVGCSAQNKSNLSQNEDDGIIVGFSQIGAESAWRTCNTRSVQDAATEQGVQLVYANAEQKQENQIKALRSFIAYQVDVIVFIPIVTDGWDNVLQEARDAGIPVLVTDRKIDVADQSLYA
ncbi:MAG TPA: substrate-binding domain-containing protein, partial [Sphaerochaeta sp.]|nr:substrate-binding domain-containing protein [Sphaerochaeta sp.]